MDGVINDEGITKKIFLNMNIKDLSNCLLVNKEWYKQIINIYKTKQQETIDDAKDCVMLCNKYIINENHDLLSTICYEMIDKHDLFLMLNWNKFSTNLIHHIDNVLKKKNDTTKMNIFRNELEAHRNKMLYICRYTIDLYKYTKITLKNVLNGKGLQNKTKDEIISMLKKIK